MQNSSEGVADAQRELEAKRSRSEGAYHGKAKKPFQTSDWTRAVR
jgi:hypothetical protein